MFPLKIGNYKLIANSYIFELKISSLKISEMVILKNSNLCFTVLVILLTKLIQTLTLKIPQEESFLWNVLPIVKAHAFWPAKMFMKEGIYK